MHNIQATTFIVLFVLFSLFLMAGCGAQRNPAFLGIIVDKELQVIAIEPHSPALDVGVQVGDLLLDLTWFTFSNNVRNNDSKIDKSPVPFTDRKRIAALMDYEYLLKLRVRRGSEILEFIVQPTVPVWRKYSEPTPTPLWPPNRLY